MSRYFSSFFPDSSTHRLVAAVFFIALIFRLAIFGYLYFTLGEYHGLAWVDGSQYVALAKNIASGNGFSESSVPPFLPHTLRTPGYPWFLAAFYGAFGNFWSASLAEAVLNSFVPLFIFWLALKLSGNSRIAFVAGLLTAVDYHIAVHTLTLNTESIFVFLAVLSAVFIFRYIEKPDILKATAIGLLFGFGALTRPLLYYAFVPIFIFFVFSLRIIEWRRRIAGAACFLLIAFAITIPWMYRNYRVSGEFTLSTLGWFNMYTRMAAMVQAAASHQSYTESLQVLVGGLNEGGYISRADEHELFDVKFIPLLRERAIEILKAHPRETLLVQINSVQTLFTQDDLLYILNHSHLLPDAKRPPIPLSLLVMQKGVSAWRDMLPYLKGQYLIPYLMRVVWIVFFALAVLGVWSLARSGEYKQKVMTWFLVALIGFIVVVSLPVSASLNARYRIPFAPFYFIFVAAGMVHIFGRTHKLALKTGTHTV